MKNNNKNPAKPISIPLLIAAALAGLAVGNHVRADEVFHWVDENGVVHFSQWAPDDVANISTVVVSGDNPPGYDPLEDPYSVRNQAERVNKTWQALEERKEERLEKKREARQSPGNYPAPPYYDPYAYRSPYAFYGPIYRPIRPPQQRPPHVRPPHVRPPHVRPPIYPGKPVRPIAVPTFAPDPMRSAHIGVRRNP